MINTSGTNAINTINTLNTLNSNGNDISQSFNLFSFIIIIGFVILFIVLVRDSNDIFKQIDKKRKSEYNGSDNSI